MRDSKDHPTNVTSECLDEEEAVSSGRVRLGINTSSALLRTDYCRPATIWRGAKLDSQDRQHLLFLLILLLVFVFFSSFLSPPCDENFLIFPHRDKEFPSSMTHTAFNPLVQNPSCPPACHYYYYTRTLLRKKFNIPPLHHQKPPPLHSTPPHPTPRGLRSSTYCTVGR